MDTEFARTFLAVVATGNFVGAAERLHVTQSTVSARIQALETQLGVRLLRRGRGGAELTAAGQRFLRHAKTLVQTLEQARQDVGLPEGFSAGLTVAGRIALWEGFLPKWADWMRREMPRVSLRLAIGFEEEMMQGLVQGTIDVATMYTPQSRPGLAVERLFDDSLVLVSSRADGPWPDHQYVHIDWGPEFYAQFNGNFPGVPQPAVNANIGWLGVQSILAFGGSGYFPLRLTRHLISDGRLHPIKGAPRISLPAHMVYPLDREDEALLRAVSGLREFARDERELLGQASSQ